MSEDILDELLEDIQEEEEEQGKDLPSNEDVKALQEKLDMLEKEKHGLLQDVKSERRKRQDINGRLSQLTETVNGIISARQQLAADSRVPVDADGIPIEFDDDGDGKLPKAELDKILMPYAQKISQLEQMLQQTNVQSESQREAENIKRSIIGEDERFETASRKYDAARRWVIEKVSDFTDSNRIGRALTSGEALDYVFDESAEAAFKARFPGIDLERVVTAEDSQRSYRNALRHIADALTPADDPEKMDGRFQKVLHKPSGLGNTRNAKGGELSIAEKVGSLRTEDIMNLSDKQIEQLQRAMASEEKSGGVTF